MKLTAELEQVQADLNDALANKPANADAAVAALVNMNFLATKDSYRRGVPLEELFDFYHYMAGCKLDMEQFPEHYGRKFEDLTQEDIENKLMIFNLGLQKFLDWLQED